MSTSTAKNVDKPADGDKRAATSQVMECLTFETPPPTPEHMKKYRKKHNQVPGMKVIHYGLRDDVIPEVEAPLNTSHDINAVTEMFSEGHHTELGKYIKDKDEINYKRHQMEPLGKSVNLGHTLPDYTKATEFAFGVKSERSEAGTKELVEIDTELKVQQTFSRMPLKESIDAQKEVIQKRDYHYDWKQLGVDPETFIFGKTPKVIVDEEQNECVANSLKFEDTTAGPLNPPRTKPMPEDHIYGLEPRNNDPDHKEWGVSECIHSDVVEKKNVLTRDRPENIIKLSTIYGKRTDEHIPSRLNPDRITSGDLVTPSKYSEMGIHPEEFVKQRPMEDILLIHSKAGYAVKEESVQQIKELIATKHGNVCSLETFKAAMDSLSC